MITIAFSHRDSEQAERLVRWIGFLSTENGNDLKDEPIALIPSRAAHRLERTRKIIEFATCNFRGLDVVIPDGENEKGWPASPNFMFRTALQYAESKGFRDVLWVEPDCIPITPDWYQVLKFQFAMARKAGKYFLGAFVKHNINHMSGNAFYAGDWRKVAPKLVQADKTAWDVYAADQVMPNAQYTKLIQHVFRTPTVRNMRILDPEAVLFHQDKLHNLMHILDRERYKGRFFGGKSDVVEHQIAMTRYYLTKNATKPIVTMGFTFTFAPCQNICGSWRGILALSKEEEQIAIGPLLDDPRSGVSEIDEADFNARLKKKPRSVKVSPVSAKFKQPAVSLEAKVGSVGPVAKAEASAPAPATDPVPVTVEQVLETGPIEPTEQPPPKKRRARKVKANALE